MVRADAAARIGIREDIRDLYDFTVKIASPYALPQVGEVGYSFHDLEIVGILWAAANGSARHRSERAAEFRPHSWTAARESCRTPVDIVGELEITRRISAGALLVERGGQLGVARLQLLEQAHVLDGDHGLIGKCLEQLDFTLTERTGERPRDPDRPEDCAISEHRHHQEASPPGRPREAAMIEVRILCHVRYVDDRTIEHRPCGDHPAVGARGEGPPRRIRSSRREAVQGPHVHQVAVEPKHRAAHRHTTRRNCGRLPQESCTSSANRRSPRTTPPSVAQAIR